LANLLNDKSAAAVLCRPLETVVEIDLFDPPQREAFRKQVVAGRASGKTERQLANELGITQPAVQKSIKLQHVIDKLSITDPYVPVTQPPDDMKKLRRHKHPDYRFEPLPGADEI
jgi:site-specific DNA recombinase